MYRIIGLLTARLKPWSVTAMATTFIGWRTNCPRACVGHADISIIGIDASSSSSSSSTMASGDRRDAACWQPTVCQSGVVIHYLHCCPLTTGARTRRSIADWQRPPFLSRRKSIHNTPDQPTGLYSYVLAKPSTAYCMVGLFQHYV